MADWTDISDSNIEPGKPVRAADGLALRDNPVAIAEGASGAPRISAKALHSGSVEKDWVLNRTADAIATAVGTYSILRSNLEGELFPGDTVSGSSMYFTDVENNLSSPNSDAKAYGTWRCMAYVSGRTKSSLFLRIS